MKATIPALLASLMLIFPMPSSADGGNVLWTDAAGRTIEAEYVDMDDSSLFIRKQGMLHEVPVERLAPASVRQAEDFDARRGGTPLGKSIVRFCRARLWKKVGDGQCASLASHALRAAGAAGRGPDFPGPGDYVWGGHVGTVRAGRSGVSGIPGLSAVRPGDIIQFRGARFEGRRAGGGTYWMNADHHTAIVARADVGAGEISIFHQNWGRMVVRRDVLVLADLKTGWLRIYRPRPGK
ncbi:MAG: hypothetical protein KDN05_04315 [Verrucomicrobiae bacterium]|nr:hypothetical protein [Verrucomicrobiae bacterium]MCP5533197.1 hypothetical protein [Akkermansiaceae bacterium]